MSVRYLPEGGGAYSRCCVAPLLFPLLLENLPSHVENFGVVQYDYAPIGPLLYMKPRCFPFVKIRTAKVVAHCFYIDV